MDAQELRNKIIQKAWQDAAFKKALLADPKSALAKEFNIIVPAGVEVKAVEETKNLYYLVIPAEPTVAASETVKWD